MTAIQPRAKGADEKTATAERLWALGSPTPLAGYAPPWRNIGVDIWARLLAALEAPAARQAAASAALLEYAACARALIRGAPAVYRALTEIRGLAIAVTPALAVTRALVATPAVALPGEPLVYDDVAF